MYDVLLMGPLEAKLKILSVLCCQKGTLRFQLYILVLLYVLFAKFSLIFQYTY